MDGQKNGGENQREHLGMHKMTDKTMMRVNKDLLREIDKIKLVKRESYADVVKRLIDRERRVRK